MKLFAVLICLSFAIRAQNITVNVGGALVGTRGSLNLEPGNGIAEICNDDGPIRNRITCAPAVNSSVLATHDSVHNNENYCSSTNGTPAYTCRLPGKAITVYQTGMAFVLVADATCNEFCTLNIDNVGVRNIKKSDGSTDPKGTLIAGRPQWVYFDGTLFRLMENGGGGTPLVAGAGRASDVVGRRFISSLDVMNYASAITLETTAGDMHKTTTNNAVGNTTINAATPGLPGQHMWIIIENDQLSGKTVRFGNNFRSAGPLAGAPGKAATFQFISDGNAWYEVARTTNL